jgi:hypothetical protein
LAGEGIDNLTGWNRRLRAGCILSWGQGSLTGWSQGQRGWGNFWSNGDRFCQFWFWGRFWLNDRFGCHLFRGGCRCLHQNFHLGILWFRRSHPEVFDPQIHGNGMHPNRSDQATCQEEPQCFAFFALLVQDVF